MRRNILIFFFCVAALSAAAQKIISVRGEFTYYAPSSMTLDAAKQEAILQTRLHVLAAKFGTLINSTTTLIIENTDGADASSRSDVRTLATHEVKGEWLEDTRQPEQTLSFDPSLPNTTIIHTRVWGKAREIVAAKAEFEIRLLKSPNKNAIEDVFTNEQPFYVYFQSPVAGYITVYLLDMDEDKAYCLLPDANDSRGNFPVESNREYILFDDYPNYVFSTNKSACLNHLIVVFSPNEFFKANDRQSEDEHYILPRETTLKQFQQWLARCKSHDNQLVEKITAVKIVK